jgi:IS605 OrfB family transposase
MNDMYLTEEHQISTSSPHWQECDLLCFAAKNLYNACLYEVRQHFFSTKDFSNEKGNVFSRANLYQVMKNTREYRTVEHDEIQRKINVVALGTVFSLVEQNFKSYLAGLKAYKKNPKDFTEKPKLPKYKYKSKGRCVFTFPSQAVSSKKKKGYIHLSKTDIYIKTDIDPESIKEVKIVPSTNHYKILISYEVAPKKKHEGEHKKIAGIDLGVSNLVTLSSNDQGFQPVIINGRPLKSINQGFNKERARLQSRLAKDSGNSKRKSSPKILNLTKKRNNKVKDYLHKASRLVVNHLVANNITCLVVGNNKGWKQEINLGKKTNQNFVSIPFATLIQMLTYKCELEGIEVKITEESYTSKCSFLDLEPLKKSESYLGSRVKRGLFKTGSLSINADLNGSLNVIRKVFGNAAFAANPIEGYVVNPVRINL